MALAELIVLASAGITTQSVHAQTFTTLYSFCPAANCTDGVQPHATLIQATNGDLYGTTVGGVENDIDREFWGTVFKITPDGTLTTLYTFCSETGCKDGAGPNGLIEATDGAFYGTTGSFAVNDGAGTVFKFTHNETLTTLYTFCSQTDCADGEFPSSALIQAADGNFYGTTAAGGANANGSGDFYGTVFKIAPGGKLTTLHSFCSQTDCADGREPLGGVVQATNGNFYGTTLAGGALAAGTVFQITPGGTLTTLYTFCSQSGCTDGLEPFAGLIQATDGNLYGTTFAGGTEENGIVFKITPSGTLTTVYNFCSQSSSSVRCADGAGPYAGLMQASDGNFYGTTSGGGANGFGTIFKLTPGGTLTPLYSCSQTACPDENGAATGALMQATNGDLYGTSPEGGHDNMCIYNVYGGCGTIFRLSVGLGAFVETQTTSGSVGAAVKILGTDLTRATSVTFNGTPATFTVVSRSHIKTTVPTGATTGFVEVVTPRGTLGSNVVFTVTP